MWAWLGSLVVALTDLVPSTSARKAMSQLYAIVIIVIIVAAGITAIYFIVISPGSTTSTYP